MKQNRRTSALDVTPHNPTTMGGFVRLRFAGCAVRSREFGHSRGYPPIVLRRATMAHLLVS